MLYLTLLLAGLLLGALIRDLRRAVVLMVSAWLLLALVLVAAGHRSYPLADSGGALGVFLIGIVATIFGHQLRRGMFARLSRLSRVFRRG